MKLLHVPFTFYPDPVGGTEIYVEGLALEQQRLGDTVIVAAPAEQDAGYRHDGLQVRRFAVSPRMNGPGELYGDGDPRAAAAFARIVDEERPDLVHLHAFTRAVSVRLVRELKCRDIPVVFSYHTPTVSCQRGTLLRWGSEVCDGVLDVRRCSQCTLHVHGVSRAGSMLLGSLPTAVGTALGQFGAAGGLWTALRMTELVETRHRAFRALMDEVDHVVALCLWVKELLARNGVPAGKVTVSRQGINEEHVAELPVDCQSGPLRVAFFGRMDPTKGVHVLIEALRQIPEAAVQLDIYGIVQGGAGWRYLGGLQKLAAADSRIVFRDPIPNVQTVKRLREYDVLAVPSQWLETGPIVVLEAFAAGVPVIGSNLGGIAELVEDGVDGLLVEPGSRKGWADALQSLAADRIVINRLRASVRAPRTMLQGARECAVVYRQVIHKAVAV